MSCGRFLKLLTLVAGKLIILELRKTLPLAC